LSGRIDELVLVLLCGGNSSLSGANSSLSGANVFLSGAGVGDMVDFGTRTLGETTIKLY
jgi:hypothetical protein